MLKRGLGASAAAGGGSTSRSVLMAVIKKIWFPHRTGVAVLSPSIFTFHLMFVLSSQFVGGSPIGATPLASGPRHCGQLYCHSDSLSAGAAMAAHELNMRSKLARSFILATFSMCDLDERVCGTAS